MRRRIAASLALLLCPLTVSAQPGDSGGYPKYELSIAGGGGASTEDDIFNLVPDNKSKPDFLFSVSGRQNFNERLGLGVHFLGTGEETPEYTVSSPVFSGVAKFTLLMLHVGVDGRYTMMRGPIQPYGYVGLNYVTGSAEHDRIGTLNLNGISVSAGPGVNVSLSPAFALGLEGVFAFGSSKWEQRPFQNSTGDKFDPSIFGLMAHLTFMWRYL